MGTSNRRAASLRSASLRATACCTVACFAAAVLAGCAPAADPVPEPSYQPKQSSTPSPSAGASPPQPAAASPSQSAGASPKAFVFQSGVLEFGDFDPYTLGDDLFNPCTEITEEEFAAAGFHNIYVSDLHQTLDGCSFDEPDGNMDFVSGFMNSDMNFEESLKAGIVLPQFQSAEIPELFVVRGHGDGVCYTQVDTQRGGFGTAVEASPRRNTLDEVCGRAIEHFEAFYRAHKLGQKGVH